MFEDIYLRDLWASCLLAVCCKLTRHCRVMVNKRISRHHLLIDHQVKGNLWGLLERGVQESPDREEEFDPSLEVAISYAGSVGTSLWSEIQEDRAKVCPGYDMTLLSWLTSV